MPLLVVGISSGVVVIGIVVVVIGVLVKWKQIVQQFRKRKAFPINPTYENPGDVIVCGYSSTVILPRSVCFHFRLLVSAICKRAYGKDTYL